MILEYELNAEDVRQATMQTLMENLSLNIDGYQCDTGMVYNVLLKAAVDGVSIESACADLCHTADSNTIREQLNEALDVCELRLHECEMNRALAAAIPAEMPRGSVEAAMDFHDEPFYGETPELRTYTCRGKAKKGTTHFFRIATAYVIWRQVRITLAVTYVLPEDSRLAVLQRLQQRLTHLDFRPCVLYLDKGFCTTAIIRYLDEQKQATILACAVRGKQGGTRALCKGRKSYRTRHTFTDGTQVDVAMMATLVPDKTGKRRRKWLAFVVLHLNWRPKKVHDRYRRRFGIECSYRQMRAVRAVTTSRNPAVRFFLLALGLVLVNTWQRLRWEFARAPGPGPRRVEPSRFSFYRFVRFLARAIEETYGVIMSIPTHVLPESVIY
jgi:hypothetical protein